jgi:hypothetical protein
MNIVLIPPTDGDDGVLVLVGVFVFVTVGVLVLFGVLVGSGVPLGVLVGVTDLVTVLVGVLVGNIDMIFRFYNKYHGLQETQLPNVEPVQ